MLESYDLYLGPSPPSTATPKHAYLSKEDLRFFNIRYPPSVYIYWSLQSFKLHND